MDFIDNLSSKSKLVFKIHNSMSDAKLWSYLYNQCMVSNIQIDEGMSFSKLKHKISNVMLMTFPKFDKCRNLIENSHKANCSKFDQRNILFTRWLPMSLARKLPFFSSPEGHECNKFDRVKQLFLIVTGEIPSSELISRFKECNVQDDVFTFAAMFEKAYRLVMELNDVDQPTPQSMINEFVKKCTFLHPVSIICASSYNSFQEAVA
ncbi:hypothetical protein XELAEV_18041943mg [Xenopus laevis]|uniref:Uncharacterized protein n=1 Tax=Xenopus laevis TaxID=8355 RepID=A0A974H5L2_XENLA|nr:hypothetical protein XELAEV_18041943mg [Xenopus laevis]